MRAPFEQPSSGPASRSHRYDARRLGTTPASMRATRPSTSSGADLSRAFVIWAARSTGKMIVSSSHARTKIMSMNPIGAAMAQAHMVWVFHAHLAS